MNTLIKREIILHIFMQMNYDWKTDTQFIYWHGCQSKLLFSDIYDDKMHFFAEHLIEFYNLYNSKTSIEGKYLQQCFMIYFIDKATRHHSYIFSTFMDIFINSITIDMNKIINLLDTNFDIQLNNNSIYELFTDIIKYRNHNDNNYIMKMQTSINSYYLSDSKYDNLNRILTFLEKLIKHTLFNKFNIFFFGYYNFKNNKYNMQICNDVMTLLVDQYIT